MTAFRIALLVTCTGLASCASPETTRTRGGGPGADVGNRSHEVKMHEGSYPYWKTPERIEGTHPSLEPARQAQRISLSRGEDHR
jgi:hypothetical protein